MIFAKTLELLQKLTEKENPNKKYTAEMNIILDKLHAKAHVLEAQLENEKNAAKRKSINLMLKVIEKQQQKGKNLIQEREKDTFAKVTPLVMKPDLSPRILSNNF